MGCELFIYWRLPSAAGAEQALAAARLLQQQLCLQMPGLQARLYRRRDEAAGRLTVMETYAVPGGLTAPQQAQIVQAGHAAMAPWCPAQDRHVERFEPWD